MENRNDYQSAFRGPRMVIRDWFGQRVCQFPLAQIVLSLCLCLTVLILSAIKVSADNRASRPGITMGTYQILSIDVRSIRCMKSDCIFSSQAGIGMTNRAVAPCRQDTSRIRSPNAIRDRASPGACPWIALKNRGRTDIHAPGCGWIDEEQCGIPVYCYTYILTIDQYPGFCQAFFCSSERSEPSSFFRPSMKVCGIGR